jgi:signal transduction histidine kinase
MQVLAIVQEAFSNIIRHSKARHILVAAHHPGERLQIMIKDDGIGIPVQFVEGNGLRNMRDRAALLRGELIVKRLEKGTSVSLDIPCTAEA